MKPLAIVLALAAAAWLGWCARPTPPRLPQLTITVHDTITIFQDRPVEKLRFVDRIIWRESPPDIIIKTDTLIRDSTKLIEYCGKEDLPPKPVLPPVSLRYEGKTLRFWSYLADGRAFYQQTTARSPWQAITVDSTLVVREQRAPIRFLKTLGECALGSGIGAVGGLLTAEDWKKGLGVGAITGCATAALF